MKNSHNKVQRGRRMQSFTDAIDGFLQILLLPATLIGAGGGMLFAFRCKRDWKERLFAISSGVYMCHIVMPIIAVHVPTEYHYSVLGAVGYGGVELMGFLYMLSLDIIAYFAHRRIGMSHKEALKYAKALAQEQNTVNGDDHGNAD